MINRFEVFLKNELPRNSEEIPCVSSAELILNHNDGYYFILLALVYSLRII